MSDPVVNPVPVGQFLDAEIVERGWTQAEFAVVLGRPAQFVSEIVNGKKEITRESAAQIGAALGQTPGFWLRLQDQYLLSEQNKDMSAQRELDEVRRRARLNSLVPVALLKSRGIVKSTSLDELENEVLALLEMQDLADEHPVAIAARRSNQADPVSSTQRAWVACVRRQARERTGVTEFSQSRFESLAASLPSLLRTPAAFQGLPSCFAEAGVCLVYVEALPGSKIDGCSFLLDGTPVVALSGRGKRLDKVLWTLMHEVAHVSLDHVSPEVLLEAMDDRDLTDAAEAAADQQAHGWVCPTPLPAPPARVGRGWVQRIAAERNLAPIVVVGQLQQRKILDWRTTLAKDAPTVTAVLETW